MKTLVFILALVMFVQFEITDAVCCSPKNTVAVLPPFWVLTGCCGVGKCNILCCNCDYGCRRKCSLNFGADDIEDESRNFIDASRKFGLIDSNSDGHVSAEEVLDYAKISRIKLDPKNKKWFTDMDTNGDGKISPVEFDQDLEQQE